MIVRVLAVLAVAAAGFTGWRWWSSSDSAGADLAAQRDNVLAVAERQVVELNTIDFSTVDADFDRWRDAATGPLLERLLRNRETDRQTALTARTVARARVVTAALTSMNTYDGTANVIAAVEITLNQQPPRVSRMDVDLARTGDGWKIGAIEVVGT